VISELEEIDINREQEPLGFEPTPEMPPATTYEGRGSMLLLPEEWGERPLVGPGSEMLSAIHEGQSPLSAYPPSPSLTPPPSPRESGEGLAPVLTARASRRSLSWEFEKNYDTAGTATTTLSGEHAGATLAPARVQHVSKTRLKFKGFQEMSCQLENCRRHGGDGNPSTTPATVAGGDRDSGTTLAAFPHSHIEDRRPAYQMRMRQGIDWGRAAARMIGGKRDSGATLVTSMHSVSEGRPERKQHLEGVYSASKRCGGCQVGVGGQTELSEKKRRVNWMWAGWLAALSRSVTVHSHPAVPDLDNPDTSLSRVSLGKF